MSGKEHSIDFVIRAAAGSGFHGAFSKAQQEFTRLGKEIQEVQRVQRDVSAYQKQQAAVEKTGAKLKNLQRQYDLLQREIEETDGSTTALEREKVKLENRIRETTAALETQNQRLSATGDRLKAAEVDTGGLSQADARLTEQLKALHTEQERAAESAADYAETASSGFTAAGQALAAAGIAAGLKQIGGAYAECVRTAAGFGFSMSSVGALSGASDRELSLLSDKAKEMGAATKFTARESADAFGYMALAGWDAQKQIAGIEPVLNLATAANMDLAKASDIVTDYLTAFGLTANDVAAFTDKMAYAMSHSNTDVVQLGEAYKNVASTAKSMNVSVEDTTAVLMGMANAGVKGGEAGTALNAVLTRLATDASGCAGALAEYGVEVYNAEGRMNSLSDILSGMSGVWNTLSDAEQAALAKTIAGAEQYSALQTIMSACGKEAAASGQSFSDYAAALHDCSGTAGKMAEQMLDNLSGDLVKFDSALDAVKLTLGEQFTPELRGLTELGTDALTLLNRGMEKSPAVTKAITAFTGVVGLATAGVAAYSAAVKAAQALNLGAMFASAGPFLAGAAGVAALTGAAIGLRETYEETVPEALALEDAVKSLNETLRESAVADISDAALVNAAAAENYLQKIEELGAVQNRTESQEVRYQSALAGLLQVAPELSDCIGQTADEYGNVTYALVGTNEEIEKNIKLMKQQALTSAYQDQLTEIAKGVADAQIARQKAAAALEDAQAQQAALVDGQGRALVARQAELVRALPKLAHTNPEEYEKLHAELELVNIKLAPLNGRIYANAAAVSEADKALTEAAAAEEELYAAMEANGLAMDENAGAADDLAAGVDGLGGALEGAAGSSEAFQAYLTELSESANAVAQAYQEVYNEVQSSVSGQFSLWDEAEGTVAAKSGAIEKALESQTQYWAGYNANLENLEQRAAGIEGLSDLLAELAGSGPSAENADYLAGLAKLTDEELRGIVEANKKLKEERQKTADGLMELRTDLEGELDKYSEMFADAIAEMDQSEEAREAVENTIEGFIEAANDPALRSELRAAFAELARTGNISLQASEQGGAVLSKNGLAILPGGRLRELGGYASGTRNAERGPKLVGEDGPEIIYFGGGESVLNARETAAVLDAPAAMPEAVYMGGASAAPQVNVAINVSGNATQEAVQSLRESAEDLADRITEQVLNALDERQEDARRLVIA